MQCNRLKVPAKPLKCHQALHLDSPKNEVMGNQRLTTIDSANIAEKRCFLVLKNGFLRKTG